MVALVICLVWKHAAPHNLVSKPLSLRGSVIVPFVLFFLENAISGQLRPSRVFHFQQGTQPAAGHQFLHLHTLCQGVIAESDEFMSSPPKPMVIAIGSKSWHELQRSKVLWFVQYTAPSHPNIGDSWWGGKWASIAGRSVRIQGPPPLCLHTPGENRQGEKIEKGKSISFTLPKAIETSESYTKLSVGSSPPCSGLLWSTGVLHSGQTFLTSSHLIRHFL